ncbi:transketolase family protein [Homoserinibacter sp. YIM 151385]|uniref:transketolase family protein n=1 Tax=Homoserinibacter sp. YIM 151385 TaxID=2985506 RepID=UPI0022F097EC|nr:transketolase C-terminal domain-containing protein [Homoserinibacter sp. YIM 151385]WBU37918.1 transketolase family protein [Homoserinibacter sp. YIM 151385]
MSAETSAAPAVHDNRIAFAEQLIELARTDERIVAVCNDSVGSSNLTAFRDEFPDRLINVGIAEQDMVGVGAGLANAGLIPFVCAASPFLTGRSLEQVKADVAYSRHNVILCGMSPGMAYGELGPTHHSVEDLSWLRALPGLDILVPADRAQTRDAVRQAAADPRPMFIRVGRHKVPDVTPEGAVLERGRIDRLRDGEDVTIVATGTLVSRALAAADALEARGISAAVLNAAWIAPFDTAAIEEAARGTRAIVTAEEANTAGGLGAAVASVVGQLTLDRHVSLRILGLTEFAPTGSTDVLLEHFGLTADGIVAAAEEALVS